MLETVICTLTVLGQYGHTALASDDNVGGSQARDYGRARTGCVAINNNVLCYRIFSMV